MTQFQKFLAQWGDCHLCPLAATRKRVCLVRGSIPCQVLFVGEAPGESEDVIGKPFVGPAGRLLERIISQALTPETTYALTNLVGCIPREDTGKKAQEPSYGEIKTCMPRLIQLIHLCQPRLLVCVGSLADTWLDPKCQLLNWSGPTVSIVHPAFILRTEVDKRELLIQRTIVRIREAFTEYVDVTEKGVLAKNSGVTDCEGGKKTQLAINLYDLERANPQKELALGNRLSQEPIWIDKNRKEEKALQFVCDLLPAAIVCDMIREQDRKRGKFVTRVYLKKTSWRKLKENDVLTLSNHGTVILNPRIFMG